ncbi:MAG: pyridoxal phosphate-dependent aminotransferase, partial [Thermoplasmata archaeon]|nr:pyridoxal phosphate-dependent aminotransferase [Thermoplasmata archaeon]
DLLNWLNGYPGITHNLGSSSLPFLRLTDFPGFDPEEFDFNLDCGTDMGDPELKEEIARLYSVESENVAITSSASEGNLLVEALYSPRTIAVETPSYEPLWKVANVLGSKVILVPRPYEDGFEFSPEELKERVRGTSLIVLTNLHNPSGTTLRASALKEIVEICEDADTTVLVDEIFRRFSDVPSAIDSGENVVINSSPSKFFGGCGLRIGYLVGPSRLIKEVDRLKILLSPNCSVISQRAYLLMMRNLDWFIGRGREIMEPNLRKIKEWISQRADAEWVPSEANIAFPRITNQNGEKADTMALGRFLAERHKVLITPGEYFGMTGHIRIGYGIPCEKLEQALEALSNGLDGWWGGKKGIY